MKKSYIIILFLGIMVLIGCTNQQAAPSIKPEKEKVVLSFKEEYPNVTEEHPFVERNIYQIEKIFQDQMTGIILFAFPDCPKCQQITAPLEQVAKNNNIQIISYFNPLLARKNNTQDYQKMISYFSEILPTDEYGEKTLITPLVLFVKDGLIIDYHQGSLVTAPVDSDNLDETMTNELINIIDNKLKKMNGERL